MKLLTKAIEKKLLANWAAAQAGDENQVPVVKFFNPCGAATWLITEMAPDGVMFGLCDLGHGCPELGYVAKWDLEAIRLPFGLKIERDLHWEGEKPIQEYADDARAKGHI